MSMLLAAVAKWILVGALVGTAATTVFVTFWDKIRQWLTNVAADAVEETFGYKARKRMCKAIARIDRGVNVVKNRSTIYAKKDDLDTYFLKTDIESECPSYEIPTEVLEEIKKKGELVQEFKYTK